MDVDLRTQSTVTYIGGRPFASWRITDLIDEMEARFEVRGTFDSEIVFEITQRALAAEGIAVAERG